MSLYIYNTGTIQLRGFHHQADACAYAYVDYGKNVKYCLPCFRISLGLHEKYETL